jgi:triosephosphate isomerase
MKNIWVIANWKSNKNISEALEWIAKVGPQVHPRENIKVVVCPQFEAIEEVKKAIQTSGYQIIVGSQDLSPFAPGAYTGEESAQTLSQLVTLSILGHSERRQNFGETDEMVAKKVEQALNNKIVPLVCVQGKEIPIPTDCKLIAYEPIFAIGTGTPDTPQNAGEVAKFLKDQHGQDLEVLYGGSVNHENCLAFVKEESISGLLIGKASLDPEEFIKIVDTVVATPL